MNTGPLRRPPSHRMLQQMIRRALAAALGVTGVLAAVLATPAPATTAPQLAYRPVAVTGAVNTLHNTAVGYTGPRLTLAAHAVGQTTLGYEPMVGVDLKGRAFYNGRLLEGSLAGKQINEQGFQRSLDNGRSWTEIGGGVSQHWTSQDPYLYVDPDTGRVFWHDMVTGGATLSISDDAGTSWTTNHIQTVGMNDRPTVVAGRVPRGSALKSTDPAFPKVVYFCSNTIAVVSCARSLDGGRTFLQIASPLGPMSQEGCSSLTGRLSADRDGRIFIGGADCGVPYLSVSEDAGDTWSTVRLRHNEGSGNITSISTDYDVETAIDSAGVVYAMWHESGAPVLGVSRDHGRHFGTPRLLAPPGLTAVTYASIAAGDAGRLAVSMLGTRGADGDDTRAWGFYLAVSTNAASADPLYIASTVDIPGTGSNVVGRGSDCCSPVQDFLNDVVAPTAGGRVWASLSDGCTGACVKDPHGASDNANIGRAYVVRQLTGPAMRGRSATLSSASP